MSNLIWTLEGIQKLIDLLYTHPYVWNRDLYEYRHRQTRERGFQIIAHEMDMTTQAIKSKLSNLKSRYKLESMKVESSKKAGSFYRPTLAWYSDFRDLMLTAPEYNQKSEPSVKMGRNDEEEAVEASDDGDPDEEEDDAEFEGDIDNSNPDTIVVSISQEFLDSGGNNENIDFTLRQFKRKKHKIQPKITIADVYGDEFQMFADHIAEQLKKMPVETAMILQNNIQNMIDEACFADDSS